VAVNIAALGGRVRLVGVVGNDPAAARLLHALAQAGVPADGLVVEPSRPTTLKSRVVAGSQHIVRFDRESDAPLLPATRRHLLAQVQAGLAQAQVLLISDYAKGVVSPPLIRRLLPWAQRRGIPVAVDPKVQHLPLFRGVTVVAPNHHEAAAAARILVRQEADLLRVGRRLLQQLRVQALLITRGEQGMALFEAAKPVRHIPTFAREVYDVTGAGDTVMAALALALAAGAPLATAALLANYAAGVVVGKRGTATVSREELGRVMGNGHR
jgi:D-beta-D-heptose 7-phosphate kinase/D-beta-D-heptose 1-phosphate adenosyltransferase